MKDRSRERTNDPGATGVRWFKLYEDLAANDRALAYPMKWKRSTEEWEAETDDAKRRYIYSGSADVTASADEIVQCVRMPWPNRWEVLKSGGGVYIGKTDAAIAKSASGTVSRYDGEDRTDTGVNDTVYNLFANVAITKWVAYTKIGGTFYMISAEC